MGFLNILSEVLIKISDTAQDTKLRKMKKITN